jgi:hypothetical protein
MIRTLAALAITALVVASSSPASAAGDWIDGPRVNWNQAGMALPAAPSSPPSASRCAEVRRRPETYEDKLLAAAGWTLWGSYQAGWGMVAVKVLADFDEACRPMGYQEMVFVDGAFAGTISPVLMNARTDGAGAVLSFGSADSVVALFRRYKSGDDPCCPSAVAAVPFIIDRSGPSPVLVPTR